LTARVRDKREQRISFMAKGFWMTPVYAASARWQPL